MAKDEVITRENFDLLLAWLDPDREAAAGKYEKIRQRLIRIFIGRGCYEAEALADATFNRVMRKLPQLAESYVGEPVLYFYGVADKIHLEWLRQQKKLKQLHLISSDFQDAVQSEIESACLENCLEKLPDEQRRMIVEYYREEKSAKIRNRLELARTFGINISTLKVRAFRVRDQLKKCLRNCVAEKGSV